MPYEMIYGPVIALIGAALLGAGLIGFGYANDHPGDIISGPLSMLGSVAAICGLILTPFGLFMSAAWLALLAGAALAVGLVFVVSIVTLRVARRGYRSLTGR